MSSYRSHVLDGHPSTHSGHLGPDSTYQTSNTIQSNSHSDAGADAYA